jgi:hypothetical protein
MVTTAEIPIVEDRFVCIATRSGAPLAAVVSSYFRDAGRYFAVFEFPTLDFPYTGRNDPESDGYFARAVGEKASGEINNALARVQPQTVLLIGLSQTEQTYIRAQLPADRLVEINSVTDFLSKFDPVPVEKVNVACKPSQVAVGLLAAKIGGTLLQIDETAPDLPARSLRGKKGLIIVDGGNDVHDLAAINYAVAFELDVAIVPTMSRDIVRRLPQILAKWSDDNSYHEFKEFERKALRPLKDIDFRRYEFATFFTQGIPYGLFLQNIIPFSHVWKQINCGIFIVVNLMDDEDPRALGSSLHFSPQFFATEETKDVVRIFAENKFLTKELMGADATAQNLADFAGYYPYDVLHICSHGGETGGYFVVQNFKDRDGKDHRIEFYEVVQIDPVDTEMAKVTRKMIYHRFDGHKWGSQALRQMPAYMFEDMGRAMRSAGDRGVIRVHVKYPIAFSCHIRCHDGLHQGAFHTLSDIGRPFVFNNSCSSSHELGATFVDAGSRAYLGTLWDVGNETATRAARSFYLKVMQEGNLLTAFHEMVNLPTRKKDANVYIFWGLHFSTLTKPREKSDARIFGALLHSFLMWVDKVTHTEDPVIKRNGIPIVAFLHNQLLSEFTEERLNETKHFDPEAFDQLMRSVAVISDEDFTRGIEQIVESQLGSPAKQPDEPLP